MDNVINQSDRKFNIDNIKGILIFLVVFGHFLLVNACRGEGVCFDIYSVIYLFHMPFFMFISGLLSHKTDKSWFIKMLSIYFVFNSIYLICMNYFDDVDTILNPAYSMWYILLLIICRFVITVVDDKYIFVLWIFAIVSFIVFQLYSFDDLLLPVKFGFLFIYFLAGYSVRLFKDKIFSNVYISDLAMKYVRLICFVGCVVCICVFYYLTKTYRFTFYMLNHSSSVSVIDFIVLCFTSIITILFIFCVFVIVPNKKIFFLTKLGCNSLYVYLLHRIVVLFVEPFTDDISYIRWCILFSIALCVLFSCNFVKNLFERCFYRVSISSCLLLFGLSISVISILSINGSLFDTISGRQPEIHQSTLDDCAKISFTGDMLFFGHDMTARYNTSSAVFDSIAKYLGDYNIGTFEGIADESDYSVGNYYDNSYLFCKYPESFVETVAKHFDLVNIGTNHLMDGGLKDVEYTRQLFDKYDLDSVGAYLSKEEYDSVKIVNCEGISMAILSYCDLMNYQDELTEYTYHKFDTEKMLADINYAKSQSVDLIVCVLHQGIEFRHETTDRQDYFNKFLAKNGVDVILSDHPHVVEPIEYVGDTLVCNCPGNLFTSLTTNDQDYGMIFNFYVHKNSKKIVTASIVPVKSVVDEVSVKPVSCYDLYDIAGTNLVLENAIGMHVRTLSPEYFYNKHGYLHLSNDSLSKYECFDDKSVCFLGDSITYGSVTNLHGWYEYLEYGHSDNISYGGWTSFDLLQALQHRTIPDDDVYVIAIGTNDVRHSAMNVDTYLHNIESIVSLLPKNKEIVLVSPWLTHVGDGLTILIDTERDDLIFQYNDALQLFATNNGYTFVDTYLPLKQFFESHNIEHYMVDPIHPNQNEGNNLYSRIFAEEYKKFLDK